MTSWVKLTHPVTLVVTLLVLVTPNNVARARAILMVLAMSCGPTPTLRYRGVEVWVGDGTNLWVDFEPAVDDMYERAPESVMRSEVYLVTDVEPTCGVPNSEAAGCYMGGLIIILSDYSCETNGSALPHELAHRWQEQTTGIPVDPSQHHNDWFKQLESTIVGDWRPTETTWDCHNGR